MTTEQLKEIHRLHEESDIEMLQTLLRCCNEEDKEEVSLLLYLNDTVGIGWGEPNSPAYEKEFKEREGEYFERKRALLKKYDSEPSWQ